MRRKYLMISALNGLLLAFAAGCSGDDSDAPNPSESGAKTYRLTISETGTRATLTDEGGKLTAKWEAGDAVKCCDLDGLSLDRSIGRKPNAHDLTAQSATATSLLTGEVACNKGDHLAVAYPAVDFSWSGDDAKYTITISGQDGTLEKLQRDYHYVYGVATVESVDETAHTAQATMMKMKSLLTVCKFSFKDSKGDIITLKKLAISYAADGEGGDNGTYPQTATVVCGASQAEVHASAVPSSIPLIVEGSGETFYVALLPVGTAGAKRTFRFDVTDQSGHTYSGTANATLTEGEFVEAMINVK